MTKNNYWAEREKAERLWQKEQDKDLDKYIQHIGEMYQKTIDNINREIKADVGIANGHLIKAEKMAEYERLAKDMVKKADAMRAKGHTVTRKDFSKDVNDRLKIYNATMRVNRNEILKSMIGEQLVDLGMDQEIDLTKKLWNDYTKEKVRQAGILGVTTKSKVWSDEDTAEIIYGQIANANFSKRIWANIDGLKGQLDGLVSTAIIRGDNPKEMAKWLTGEVAATVSNQKYVAERLARTETARVQFSVQKMSALQNSYKYVKWYAEGSACKYCKAIVSDDVGYGDGIYPVKEVPDIPVHPNCMCSIGAYWVEDDKIKVDDTPTIDVDTIDSVASFGKAVASLGFTTVKGMNGVGVDDLKVIYQTVADNFASHPELKGYLTTLQGRNRKKSSAVAWVSSGMKPNSQGNLQADISLNINKPYLKDFDATVKRCVEQHWWTKKKGYAGTINHELAHAIEGRANFQKHGIDYHNVRNDSAFMIFWDNALAGDEFAKEVVDQTLKTVGTDITKVDRHERKAIISKFVSDYPASYDDFASQYGEAFAELYSDEDKDRPIKKVFDKILKEKMNSLYGDQK